MKNRMLILLIGCLLTAPAMGQGMPVYDNTNFISLAKSLIESAKQTSHLLKTVDFLKTQKENIEKVNNVVKQLRAVRELARNNELLVEVVREDLREILNSPYIRDEEVDRVSESFHAIIEMAMENLDFIDQILRSDHLKMTDGERTLLLREKELQSREMLSEVHRKTRRYRDIISFREMQEKINTREIHH